MTALLVALRRRRTSKVTFLGVIVDADIVGEWLFINWRNPGTRKVSAIKDIKMFEEFIRMRHLKGWYAASEHAHTTMHKILEKMGAKRFREDEHNVYFNKEVI